MVNIRMQQPAETRVDWVDHAKGICIILVVMMHSTLGVEKAMGAHTALGTFIEWARPFRMPDFFLISGLFLSRRIAAPWRKFADSKILHFAYFYVLWMTIQFLFKGPGLYASGGATGLLRDYAMGFIEPFGTLWFIYLLAIFFAVTKYLDRVPKPVVFIAAALLELLPIHTGWIVIDEFASRFVYFYAGYWLAPHVFGFAAKLREISVGWVALGLGLWAALESLMVFGGYSTLPGLGLVLGFVGAAAVISFAVMLAETGRAEGLRYLGSHSIVVYLAFFLFMATTRAVLIRFAPWLGADAIALLVTFAGVAGPVILHLAVKATPLNSLFVRPAFARVETWGKGWHSAAHDSASHIRQPQGR